MQKLAVALAVAGLLCVPAATATPFFFSTGNPDGKIATASRPESAGKIEIESADDFILNGPTSITSATFVGLLTGATLANIGDVRVEIYRVFPADSDVSRTSGPPTFSTSQVPTRVNSPSDVALDDRDTASGNLTFTASIVANSFTAANSILNGIHPKPNQTTGGDGAVTGIEVLFSVNFSQPFALPPDHYFFIPQVELNNAGGEFYWLSAPKPIVAPGTPFVPDLQSWIRNANLDPDWLRIGTDIVGSGAFNGTFSLNGVPEPATLALLGAALAGLGFSRRRKPG